MELSEVIHDLDKVAKNLAIESSSKKGNKNYAWHPDPYSFIYKGKAFEVNLEIAHDILVAYDVSGAATIFDKFLGSYEYEITGSRPSDDFMSGVIDYIYKGKNHEQKMHMLVTDEKDEAYPGWIEFVNYEILTEIQRKISSELGMLDEEWNTMHYLLTLHD